MLRTLIRLSDGTEISSGSDASMNIRNCTITQCCNSGEELTIGSVCAACVEMVVESPDGTFTTGDIFTLYKVDDTGNRTQIGIFNVLTAERRGNRLCQVTAYDEISRLDADLTEWLNDNFASLPNDPKSFVYEVCFQCGVRLGKFPTYSDCHSIGAFSVEGPVTGRRLLFWVAEMLGCFCTADPDGYISFDWYRDNTQIVLRDKGQRYRLQGSFKQKGAMSPIDGLLIMNDRDNDGQNDRTYQTPEYISLNNPYIIKDNPILGIKDMPIVFDIADHIWEMLTNDQKICRGGGRGSLVSCEVATPASLDINVGDIIIVDERDPDDPDTDRLFMRVMTKIQKGQKDTLYCTGSYRRRN